MLALSALNTHYGQAHILRDVSLQVDIGEVVALLGRNGAGKSTTMKAIIGMITASSGAIHYNGLDLHKLKNYQRARLGIGYVPEDRRIFRHLTVIENLQTGIKPPRKAGQRPWTVHRVLELFPKLDELRARLGGLLSGGEQQMLTIGRTLMTNPDCLLLDEPTEGLAPIIVQQVVEAIKLLKSEGLAILISEQNRHMAATLADRVCVLEKGQIIYGGPIAAMPPQAHRALGW
jgi:branched-chain amino acid transport system ATP-binding protein